VEIGSSELGASKLGGSASPSVTGPLVATTDVTAGVSDVRLEVTGESSASAAAVGSTVRVPTFYAEEPALVESVVHRGDVDQRERLEALLKRPFESPRDPDTGEFADTEFGALVAMLAEFAAGARYLHEEQLRQHYIDHARGRGLDEIGHFVGLGRQTGETDPAYRTRLKAFFRGLLGGATLEEVIEITADLLGTTPPEIEIVEPFRTDDAQMNLTISEYVLDSAAISEQGMVELILLYKAAGVRITLSAGAAFRYRSLQDYYDDVNDPEHGYNRGGYRRPISDT